MIVSVPVEIGPSLAVKEALRALAGWRRLGDYRFKERYGAREMAVMLTGGEGAAIYRPVYRGEDARGGPVFFHGHKGFNWKRLRRELEREFRVAETRFSPVNALGAGFASQAWFVCAPR